MGVKKTYHRVKINQNLLNHQPPYTDIDLNDFKDGQKTATLPKGICLGIYYNSYVKKLDTWSAIDYQTPVPSNTANPLDKSFICGHIDIDVKDTRGRMFTQPVDLQDFERNNWGEKAYKEINLEVLQGEEVTITWNAKGNTHPPCGEFVFVIDENPEKCEH